MESIFEKLVLGATGGMVAYWFAYQKFVSQKWWDKRYDLYIEAIEILKEISHSLAIYEWALANEQTIDDNEKVSAACLTFEEGLSKLHGLQSKLLLVGMEQEHHKLLPLKAALSMVHPSYLSKIKNEDRQEIIQLVNQSRRMAEGCSGELAFQGKENLKMGRLTLMRLKHILQKK